jgi:hypothetical protein
MRVVSRKIRECAENLRVLSLDDSFEEVASLIEESIRHVKTLRRKGQNSLADALAHRIERAEDIRESLSHDNDR